MTRRLPPLTAVRAFEAAARHGNFTRAAAELGMTQAAVSYQIKMLEDRLGQALFVRRPREVSLTATGRRIAPQVREAFDALDAAFADVRRVDDSVLSITAIPTLAATWLVARLWRFQVAHPQIAVRLDPSRQMVELDDGAYDVALRSGHAGDWPGLACHELLPVHFTPMCSPCFLERHGPFREPSDLRRVPLMTHSDPWWPIWFDAAGVTGVDLSTKPDLAFGGQNLDAAAAIDGQGAALLTPALFRRDLERGRLIQLFDVVAGTGRSYWLVYPAARARVPKIRQFRDWLLAEMAEDGVSAG
ncbi:transcriptional regulator GcvA [Salinarimonas soli]|uniref:Transcriptional regulator GcvA n=1 Tax=Salinarimonas soli TaxID=1638099 RepID=A0A5B2VSM4_9HYPH|nr:transcriptional regulator GcvA [Salinarimonas soli]KAA2241089.1 transcriptional regulator GcvA [Salinarimonas soli]